MVTMPGYGLGVLRPPQESLMSNQHCFKRSTASHCEVSATNRSIGRELRTWINSAYRSGKTLAQISVLLKR